MYQQLIISQNSKDSKYKSDEHNDKNDDHNYNGNADF